MKAKGKRAWAEHFQGWERRSKGWFRGWAMSGRRGRKGTARGRAGAEVV